MTSSFVKVSKKGMISIPSTIRKKHNIIEGQYLVIFEDESGAITLEPVDTVTSLRKQAMTISEFKKVLLQSRKEDLELEK